MPSSFFLTGAAPPASPPLPLPAPLPLWGTADRRTIAAEHLLHNSRFINGSIECLDRKSTRLNSSHTSISHAFFFFFNWRGPPRLPPSSPPRPSPALGARRSACHSRRALAPQ